MITLLPRPRPLPWFAAALLCAATAAAQEPAALLERAEQLVRIDPQGSQAVARQALALLQAPGAAATPDPQVQALMLLCEYEVEVDRMAAQQRLEAARALQAGLVRRGLLARIVNCEAELKLNAGDSGGALRLFEQSVELAERAGDRENLAQSLYHRGYVRGLRGDYAIGLADLKRAAALYDELDRPAHRTTVHNGLAIVYNRMGDAEQARTWYTSALRFQQQTGLKREQAVTWHNLGRVHENLGDWAAAEQAFAQTLALARELGYARAEAHARRGLATVHNARGRPQEALRLLDEAAAMQRQLVDERLRGQIQLQRGIAYRQLQRLPEARAALAEARAVFEQADSPSERARTHEEMARLLAEHGLWREAYAELTAFKGLSDLLLRRQIDDRFAALKAELERSAQAQEMRLLERERRATALELEQERFAGRLRSGTIVLGAVTLGLLLVLAWRLRRTGLAMRRLALTDELTGLPNRRDVLTRLEGLLAEGTPCALLIVDLDHFKRINDSQGHAAGDGVLRCAAEVLREQGRAPVAMGRLGGEEFVLVLPQAGLAEARALAERLRAAIEAMDVGTHVPGGHVTTSVGVAVAGAGDTASTLLRRADRALYLAKANGRNRVESLTPETPSAGDRSPP